MRDITIWAINVGKNAEAEALFLNKGIISPGLAKMPDLSYAGDREAVKIRYQQSYPQTKATDLPLIAAQVFRFVQEIGDGDFVVFPAKVSRKVYIGQISGNYTFRPSVNANFPHQRPVRWLKEFSRSQFSQGALFELGSALMVFKIKAHADEFRAALERKMATPDEKIIPSARVSTDEIEEQTRDFISRQLSQCPKAQLTAIILQLIQTEGYRTRSLSSNDSVSEHVAHKGRIGFESNPMRVQIRLDGKLTDQDFSTFSQGLAGNESGLVISADGFPASIWQAARLLTNVQLIDGSDLTELIFQNYDQLPLQLQQLLPLKRTLVPDLPSIESVE